jgi:cation diffusion facilitator family transporter
MEQAAKPTEIRLQGAELRTVQLSLAVGLLLVTIKFLAYYLTKSAAIFSDATENVVNVFSSAFALYAIRVAHRPADEEHPYGHGKIEFMSAGFEGGMILLAAVLIIVRAIEALALRQGPRDLTLGLLVTTFSTFLCAVTGYLLKRLGKASGSITLEADGVHLISDAVTGVVVLLALLAVRWTHRYWIDAIAAIGVGVWIIIQGLGLIRRSAAGLMDEQDTHDKALLDRILTSHVGAGGKDPRICSYHKLRHRHSGRHCWVDFHIQVPAKWDVEQGHRVATAIEMEIERILINGSATAHVEPCVAAECEECRGELSTN